MRSFLTDAEITALYSGSEAELNKVFCSKVAILIGDKIYTTKWINEHSAEELKQVGITRTMMEEKYVTAWIEYFGDTPIR